MFLLFSIPPSFCLFLIFSSSWSVRPTYRGRAITQRLLLVGETNWELWEAYCLFFCLIFNVIIQSELCAWSEQAWKTLIFCWSCGGIPTRIWQFPSMPRLSFSLIGSQVSEIWPNWKVFGHWQTGFVSIGDLTILLPTWNMCKEYYCYD